MGFYATDECSAVLEPCQENLIPPSKNRVWNFFTTSETCAGFFESQPVELHQEKWPTPTTTASGVRYYGHRYYQPECGRWASRDPLDEEDGPNLCSFVQNMPTSAVDPFGLWKWIGGKRQGGFRAKLIAESFDSVASLAPKVWMKASESAKWLRDGNDNPVSSSDSINVGCKYNVPNVVYVEQEPGPVWLMGYPVSEINRLTSQGFFVIHRRNPDIEQIKDDFTDKDIFGLIFSGEGDKDRKGELMDSTDRLLHPSYVAVHHELGGVKIVCCWGGVLGWNGLVSPFGSYWAMVSKIYIWDVNGIQRGFPYPYD